MKIITVLLAIILFSGCATIQRVSNWQTQRTQKWAYQDSMGIVSSAVNEKILKECGFIFNAPIAPTTKVESREEMKAKYGKDDQGLYLSETKEVIYVDSSYADYTLVHEYAHYIYDISNLSEYCKNQAFAYLVGYAYRKQKETKKWQKAFKNERRKNLRRP